MANYSIDPGILQKFLPYKTELDFWNNRCYVSLVGFMFQNTEVMGMRIPFHTDFEEVNLRFYVTHKSEDGIKRGVVFIKEIVPKPALTFVANTIYGENYETMPMHHRWDVNIDTWLIKYAWKKQRWNSVKVISDLNLSEIKAGSEEEFITEHYWGYTRINDRKTSEYGVEHPRWKVYGVSGFTIDVDFAYIYGEAFDFLKYEKPISVFLAEGSEIVVRHGTTVY